MTKEFVCTTCGFVGSPKKVVKGSVLIELFFWLSFLGSIFVGIFVWLFFLAALVFLVLAIAYSIYRSNTQKKVCPKCSNPTMIPGDTPMGRKLLEGQGNQNKNT